MGWTNATWPLAKLSATSDTLTIAARLLGTYSFTPEQVSSVERYSMIPVLGWGIQIRHCRTDYPQRIIFWCLGNPDTLLRDIREAGFRPTAPPSPLAHTSGNPIRWSVILVTIVVWNAFFLLGLARSSISFPLPGPWALVALLFAFALSIGTLKSPRLQQCVLKPGREVGEIRPFLRLLAFVSGLILIIFSIVLACVAFNQFP